MNVLITSVGRRNYLVNYFKDAVAPDGLIVAVNTDPLTTGMLAADVAYQVPSVDSPAYIETLLCICKKHDIKLVLSLFDSDLHYLAAAKQQFTQLGIQLAISDPKVIDVANDKWKTYQFLTQHGIDTPKTFLSLSQALTAIENTSLAFPVIIKPRWGMGSQAIYRANNERELRFFYRYCKQQANTGALHILSKLAPSKSVIIQEMLTGAEYGLDVFNNLSGQHLQTIVKQKLAMRSGETDIAKVIKNNTLSELGGKLSLLLQHHANLDVDVMQTQAGEYKVLELNARFGGGYPFSHLAGANFPNALVAMVNGLVPTPSIITTGLTGLKGISLTSAIEQTANVSQSDGA